MVGDAAESARVCIVVEILNSRIDHPGFQCDRTDYAVDIVRKVDSPYIKILYDIYHMQIMEGDLIRTIQANLEHIGHIHTVGNPGRHELDEEQEINYPAIARVLNAEGYDGYVTHEFVPKGDKLAALRQAFEVFDV